MITSLLVDLMDIVTNVVVAIFTGSAVMLAEALQGFADLASVGLLMIGNKRSRKRATRDHPFGYGKEMYFWSTLSGFIILIITAGLTFYFGYNEFIDPSPVENIWLAFAILGLGVTTNGYAFRMSALKVLDGQPWHTLPRVFLDSPHIAPKTTVVLDAMGTVAATLGIIALGLYSLTGNHSLDGLGAMVMAVVLALFSILLLVSASSLITGERAPKETEHNIRAAALSVPEVRQVLDLQTMILGSDSILVTLEVHLKDNLTTDQVEEVIDNIKRAVKRASPELIQVHVEPETPSK